MASFVQLTREELYSAVKEFSSEDAAKHLDALNRALVFAEVESRESAAQFIAQCAHESGGFKYVREIWGNTKQQQRYEGRWDLGNTEVGDGKRFMGRGWIQLTGRDNYTRFGRACEVDCVNNPELVEQPEIAWLASAWYWKQSELSEKAAYMTVAQVTKKVNGGHTHLLERRVRTEKACGALGAVFRP